LFCYFELRLPVDEPILNNPFEELREYWLYEEGVKFSAILFL
jgi:hypothetical protein